MTRDIERIVILVPNWLGDAVMALPAIADVRRAHPAARLAAAARPSVAGLFSLVPEIDDVLILEGRRRDAAAVRCLIASGAGVALLLPNSFHAAWLARRAGIPERWGYQGNARGWLLTKAVRRAGRPAHHVGFYQHLTRELGFAPGPAEPRIEIAAEARAAAADRMRQAGHDGAARVAVLAPGAAYGSAKQWVLPHVTSLIGALSADGYTCVLVGSRADAQAGATVMAGLRPAHAARVVNFIGGTSLQELAAVLSIADACVCNDSGAMHLAAAVGTPLVATFGPTDERVTAPLPHPGRKAVVLTSPVWCRPCMLRECPLDHQCMTRITPQRVHDAVLGLGVRPAAP